MGFTMQIFIFCFLPISIALYVLISTPPQKSKLGKFFATIRAKELMMIALSIAFYCWSGVGGFIQLLYLGIIVYLLAQWIELAKRKNTAYYPCKKKVMLESGWFANRLYLKRFVLAFAILILLSYLFLFKYTKFSFNVFNGLFNTKFSVKNLIAPLGISFITFSAISYLVDIYRGDASAGSFIDCALYISFFPKVVSGPIVLWKDFQPQVKNLKCNLEKTVSGANRIMIGFAKKILIADTLGACVASIGVTGIDWITAVGSMVLYMLQIYFDFAGYSDIAIGVGKLFGFDFKENFDFPYRSLSITEFWRRWHISLGTWFRQYLYFPLGGNRKGKARTILNLAIVFFLTGVWHGASLSYFAWGCINAFFIIIERLLKDTKFYRAIPSFIKYAFTMLIVLCFWQLFRFQSINANIDLFSIVLGITKFENIPYTWQYYFDPQIITFTVIGILGSTLLGNKRIKPLYQKFASTKVGFILQEVVLIAVFLLAILFMVSSTYSPFLYFQY